MSHQARRLCAGRPDLRAGRQRAANDDVRIERAATRGWLFGSVLANGFSRPGAGGEDRRRGQARFMVPSRVQVTDGTAAWKAGFISRHGGGGPGEGGQRTAATEMAVGRALPTGRVRWAFLVARGIAADRREPAHLEGEQGEEQHEDGARHGPRYLTGRQESIPRAPSRGSRHRLVSSGRAPSDSRGRRR
jgi:hypothetical protein